MDYKIINEAGAIETFAAIKFMQQLTKPFEDWEAYKLGLIDKNGKTLKKAKTPEEKKSLNLFLIFIKNIKKILMTVPGGRNKFATYAAAFFLLKESEGYNDDTMKIIIDSFCFNYAIENESHKYDKLASGIYETLLGDDIVAISECLPFTKFFNVNLYYIKNRLSNEYIIFAKETIV